MFSVSITHNSKIKELSDGNRVIMHQTDIEIWVPPFLSYELWKLRIELLKQAIQTASNTSIIHKNTKIYVENYFSIEGETTGQTLNLSTIIKSITISSQVYILEIHTNYNNISL